MSDRYISSISSRIDYLTKSSLLFCLSSLLFWYPLVEDQSPFLGLQLFGSLCLYDTFLTTMDLNSNALLIDIYDQKRESMSSASAVGSALGALPLVISYLCWNSTDLRLFRIFVTSFTLMVMCGFIVVSQSMKRIYNIQSSRTTIAQESIPSLGQFLRGLHKQKNCAIFSLVNLIQVFHCHFNSNTIPLILTSFIQSSSSASIVLGISFLLPHMTNIYIVSLCKSRGTYSVIRGLLYLKFIFSFYLFLYGQTSFWLICIFLLSNRIFTEGICKLFDLVITDLIDEDQYLHQRGSPLPTLIFGAMAFLSKPGQTFASIISSRAIENFLLIPLICSFCQIILWRKFTPRKYRVNLIV